MALIGFQMGFEWVLGGRIWRIHAEKWVRLVSFALCVMRFAARWSFLVVGDS
jgi:hypothetical protein